MQSSRRTKSKAINSDQSMELYSLLHCCFKICGPCRIHHSNSLTTKRYNLLSFVENGLLLFALLEGMRRYWRTVVIYQQAPSFRTESVAMLQRSGKAAKSTTRDIDSQNIRKQRKCIVEVCLCRGGGIAAILPRKPVLTTGCM
jgi:hypothetical protein